MSPVDEARTDGWMVRGERGGSEGWSYSHVSLVVV